MHGVDGLIVRVETDASPGTPSITIIGLPDRSLNESRDRVRSAVINSGFMLPAGRLLISLSPADVRKEGPAFDLPIALALMATDGQFPAAPLADFVMLGELALDGTVRAVAGTLPMMIAAKRAGIARALVPAANRAEAALVEGVETYAVPTLTDAVAAVLGNGAKFRVGRATPETALDPHAERDDFRDVRGQGVGEQNALASPKTEDWLRYNGVNDTALDRPTRGGLGLHRRFGSGPIPYAAGPGAVGSGLRAR
jgi:magnesium chelatase family protein